MTITSDLRHRVPEASRNDTYWFDKYVWPAGDFWPSGLEIHVYGDGRVKVDGWASVTRKARLAR